MLSAEDRAEVVNTPTCNGLLIFTTAELKEEAPFWSVCLQSYDFKLGETFTLIRVWWLIELDVIVSVERCLPRTEQRS